MTNKAIAQHFAELARIMELHNGKDYRVATYERNYRRLRKLAEPLSEMSREDMLALKGVGKATADKIQELLSTGEMDALSEWRAKTPDGVLEMLSIKGFGPSKVRVVWQELGCESVGELLYACNENRLVALKGFGEKTQRAWIEKIKFHFQSKGLRLYARIEEQAEGLLQSLREALPEARVEASGAFRRKCPRLQGLSFLLDCDDLSALQRGGWRLEAQAEGHYRAASPEGVLCDLHTCAPENWGSKWFRHTGGKAFLEAFLAEAKATDFRGMDSEEAVFRKAGIPYLPPEMREDGRFIGQRAEGLVELSDVEGVIHAHSTYSDGSNSLLEMAEASRAAGYAYLVVTDHSQSAFYANGMKEERLHEQWAEIDRLNAQWEDFKIYKGIESDILNDGRLDYGDELLSGFELVIASVHSNLRMDERKATQRLIRAIEHPATNMLGHPTGRLLLARKGYPLDMPKIIDACAANGVAIELNANPLRLDLDYEWIPACMEKGVKISINPDAHNIQGIGDIRYGVLAARKGGLRREGLFRMEF